MNEYRVTKYNPEFRTASGAYTRNEWISFSDIGRSYDGEVLTRAEYERVEDAYIAAAFAFLTEAGVPQLTVQGLENSHGSSISFANGDALSVEQLREVLRRVLREECWCRLETADAFIHFGYDYYMYVGVPQTCTKARRVAEQLGLYVEDFESPYHGDPADE